MNEGFSWANFRTRESPNKGEELRSVQKPTIYSGLAASDDRESDGLVDGRGDGRRGFETTQRVQRTAKALKGFSGSLRSLVMLILHKSGPKTDLS